MRLFYGFAAFFAVAVGLLVLDPWSYSSDSLAVSQKGDVLELRWRGEIDAPMAKVVRKALKDRAPDVRSVLFDIESPGGSVIEGWKVVEHLEALADDTVLVTRVGPQGFCGSMCVPIYMTGKRRMAAPDAEFYFHDAFAADPLTSKALPQDGRDRQYAMIEFRKQFRQAKIDEAWANELRRGIDRDGEVWATGEALYQARAGVVTRLVRTPGLVQPR